MQARETRTGARGERRSRERRERSPSEEKIRNRQIRDPIAVFVESFFAPPFLLLLTAPRSLYFACFSL